MGVWLGRRRDQRNGRSCNPVRHGGIDGERRMGRRLRTGLIRGRAAFPFAEEDVARVNQWSDLATRRLKELKPSDSVATEELLQVREWNATALLDLAAFRPIDEFEVDLDEAGAAAYRVVELFDLVEFSVSITAATLEFVFRRMNH